MLARDMNWILLFEARCKYVLVRSNAASLRRTVSGNSTLFILLRVNGVAQLYVSFVYSHVISNDSERSCLARVRISPSGRNDRYE
jgi:hypothetical protein